MSEESFVGKSWRLLRDLMGEAFWLLVRWLFYGAIVAVAWLLFREVFGQIWGSLFGEVMHDSFIFV